MTVDPTTHPDGDVLVDLATDGTAPAGVVEHVRSCPQCTTEVEALREVVDLTRTPPPDLVEPPPGLWTAVAAELDREEAGRPASRPATVTPLPSAADHGRRRDRRVAPAWLAAAAAAGIVVGGAGAAVLDRSGDDTPAPVVVGRAALDTLDTEQRLGAADAVRVDGHLDLDVQTPAIDAGTGYLEVWLINRDGTRMVSVGVLRPDAGSQRFPIDEALIDQGYVVVDISREGFDDEPAHSGDSVARGTLEL